MSKQYFVVQTEANAFGRKVDLIPVLNPANDMRKLWEEKYNSLTRSTDDETDCFCNEETAVAVGYNGDHDTTFRFDVASVEM